MNIEHISISRGKLFQECDYKYKLKYHDKIPNPGEEQFYFTYGKIIHRIAQIYVEEKAKRSLGEISTDILRGKILLEGDLKAPEVPKEYKLRMPNHLRNIQKITEKLGVEGFTEKTFLYDLDPPNKKFVKGVIDRIVIKGDSAIILDYKTTKPGPYREDSVSIKRDPQLRIYAKVVQKEFGIPAQNIKNILLYLEDYQIMGCTYSEESLVEVEKDLLNLYNQIKEKDPDTTWGRTGPHCPRCEYASICTFYKSKSAKSASWDGDMSKFY